MQVTITSADGLKRELRVQVPATDLAAKAGAKLNELKNTIRLKGFRPGKVPLAHLQKTYGKQVMSEIIQEAVGESSQQALEKETLRPAMQPGIDLEGEIDQVIDGKADLTYKMTVEIMPTFDLSDFSKISAERPVAEVSDADIDDAMKRLADNQKNYEDKGDQAADEGDLITMDFIGRIDGEVFEGGSAEDASLEIGAGRFIPGFEEQLKGVKAGESRDLNVTFPADYGAAELAGKDAVFEVKVKEVKTPAPVVLDDEFAKRFGLDDLAKLREILTTQLKSEFDRMSRMHLKRKLLDALDETHSFELPPTLVEQEFNAIWNQYEQEVKNQGKTLEEMGEEVEESRAEYRKIAERRVRLGLVLAEVGDKNKITVTEQELNQALADRARQFPGQENMVLEYYRKNPQAAAAELRAPIFEEKIVDFIIELAQVTDKPVTREELYDVAEGDDGVAHAHDHDHGHVHDENCDHDHGHVHDENCNHDH